MCTLVRGYALRVSVREIDEGTARLRVVASRVSLSRVHARAKSLHATTRASPFELINLGKCLFDRGSVSRTKKGTSAG